MRKLEKNWVKLSCKIKPNPDLEKKKLQIVFSKEIKIVHRLFLIRVPYCMGTCRMKQKQKQTKVFTNLLRGFVDSYGGSCNKQYEAGNNLYLFEFPWFQNCATL